MSRSAPVRAVPTGHVMRFSHICSEWQELDMYSMGGLQ